MAGKKEKTEVRMFHTWWSDLGEQSNVHIAMPGNIMHRAALRCTQFLLYNKKDSW